MIKDRVIALQGVHNFRDYGGYTVQGGGQVKTGLLFRSGEHGKASDEDLSVIDALDLRHVIDLRGNSERRANPCRRGEGFTAEVHFFDGETAGMGAGMAPHMEAAAKALDAEIAHSVMEQLYSQLPFRENLLQILKQYFAALAQDQGEGQGASLVHCLAGKDRTGMAVDLLHHVLGVHPDDAMEDYLLTNTAGNIDARVEAGRKVIRAKYGNIDDATIRVLMGVDARYLIAGRKAVVDEYGSIDVFLENVLGVDDNKRAALRLHLIEA